jgi:hypothetical protein
MNLGGEIKKETTAALIGSPLMVIGTTFVSYCIIFVITNSALDIGSNILLALFFGAVTAVFSPLGVFMVLLSPPSFKGLGSALMFWIYSIILFFIIRTIRSKGRMTLSVYFAIFFALTFFQFLVGYALIYYGVSEPPKFLGL